MAATQGQFALNCGPHRLLIKTSALLRDDTLVAPLAMLTSCRPHRLANADAPLPNIE